MAILWRIWAATVAVILTVLVAFLALSTFQFSRSHTNLVGERLIVLADRTAAPFEAAARIGLPIVDVRNATGVLERARLTDDRITAIYVLDDTGNVVHNTRGALFDEDTLEAIQARVVGYREWHGELGSGFAAGVRISGPTGKTVGGIAVLYPSSGSTTRVWAMAAELAFAGVFIFAVSAVAAGIMLRLGLRRTIRAFEHVEGDIAAFEEDSWRKAEGAKAPSKLRMELDASFARYRSLVAKFNDLRGNRDL